MVDYNYNGTLVTEFTDDKKTNSSGFVRHTKWIPQITVGINWRIAIFEWFGWSW